MVSIKVSIPDIISRSRQSTNDPIAKTNDRGKFVSLPAPASVPLSRHLGGRIVAVNTDPTAQSSAQPRRWSAVAVTVLCGVVGAAYIAKLAPSLPDLRADLGIGMVTGGWIVSVLSIVGMLSGMAAGMIGDRFGAARVLAAGLLLCAVGGTLGALSQTPWQVLASRVVEGAGFILIVVPAASVIAGAVHGPRRRLAFGIWGTYMPVGTALTFVAAPLILADFGWRGVWAAIAAVTLLALIPVLRFLDVGKPAQTGGGLTLSARLAAVVKVPGVWLAALIFTFYASQWVSLMIWLPTYLTEGRGLSIATASLMTAGIVVVNIPGNLLGGWLLRHGARHWQTIFAASVIMAVTSLGIFAVGTPLWLFYALCLTFSAFGGMAPATILACGALFQPDPAKMGAANGLIVKGAHMGQVVGPPSLAALVSYLGGWHWAGWLIASLAVGAMILALLLGIQERKAAT
jgi:MFS family permease